MKNVVVGYETCIKQLIHGLGQLAGREWTELAAESIMEGKSKEDARRLIGKLHYESEKHTTFEKILCKSIRAYTKKQKKYKI